MALDANRLAASMKAGIVACYGTPEDDAKLTCFCQAMATSIVDEIVNNAVVLPGSFSNGGGSVTGTGTVT